MGLNYVHEAAHLVHLRHVYNNAVAKTFWGDDLFGVDRTIPIEDRVDNAWKRVQKLSAATKSVDGQTRRRNNSPNKRGSWGRIGGSTYNGDRQQCGRQRDSDYDPRPSASPTFNRYNGGASDSYGRGGSNRDIGPRTCFICGSTGHLANQCPKAF